MKIYQNSEYQNIKSLKKMLEKVQKQFRFLFASYKILIGIKNCLFDIQSIGVSQKFQKINQMKKIA